MESLLSAGRIMEILFARSWKSRMQQLFMPAFISKYLIGVNSSPALHIRFSRVPEGTPDLTNILSAEYII
jgi:hypothetical protein